VPLIMIREKVFRQSMLMYLAVPMIIVVILEALSLRLLPAVQWSYDTGNIAVDYGYSLAERS